MDEIHWKRVGIAENEKEWATTYFLVSVAIENSLSRQRFLVPCRDVVLCVATWFYSRRGYCVATEVSLGRYRVWLNRMDSVET